MMTAKEMFEALNYKQTSNSDSLIEYTNDGYEYGNSKSVSFYRMWKEYEVGYYDGYEHTNEATGVSIKEHEAITQQLKELGWFE